MRALEGRTNDVFGPLLMQEGIWSIRGLPMIGEEVIGRIWIFTEGLPPNDRQLAREGMVSGLANSIENGSRVCNPGKVQRLCQVALQGYLPGVHLDIPEPVAPNVALEVFNRAHVDSDSGADLIAAACARAVHLQENEKLAVLNRIRAYGHAQGFPPMNRQEFIAAACARLCQNPQIIDREEFLNVIDQAAEIYGLPECTRQELIAAAEEISNLDPPVFEVPANRLGDEDAFVEEKKAQFIAAVHDYADARHLE